MESAPTNDIGYKIKRLHCTYSQFRDQNLQKLGVTSMQAFVIGYIARQETPVYAGDIGKEFGLRHPTISGLLRRMEQKGLIRYAEDEDHRRKQIFMTESAWAVHEQIMESIRMTNALAVASFTESEVAVLRGMLDRVYTNLQSAADISVTETLLETDTTFENGKTEM